MLTYAVFVMFDAWKQSLVMSSIRTTRGRLTYALDRTCKAFFSFSLSRFFFSFLRTTRPSTYADGSTDGC
jgi:hypothetical protein